jgi:hypothetical protein
MRSVSAHLFRKACGQEMMLALMRLNRSSVNTKKQAGGLRDFFVKTGCRLTVGDALLSGSSW